MIRAASSVCARLHLTVEHMIPRALGGKFTARFLCKSCNDLLGSRVEPMAKKDPSIRYAIEALKDSIPDLAAALTEGQIYVADTPHGKVRGVVKKGSFRILAKRQDDGSVIQPTPHGRK